MASDLPLWCHVTPDPLYSLLRIHSLFSVKNHKVLLDGIQAVLQVVILLWTERPLSGSCWTLWAVPKHCSNHLHLSSEKETPDSQVALLLQKSIISNS